VEFLKRLKPSSPQIYTRRPLQGAVEPNQENRGLPGFGKHEQEGKEMSRKLFFSVIAVIGLFVSQGFAAEYPSKPINLILPHPAGGASDLSARPLAKVASQVMGKPVIIDNRGGGGGTVGPTLAASKSPDGYNLGIMTGACNIAYSMGKLNFHPVEDVTHIMTYSGFLLGVVVRTESPWKTLKEFIDYSKKNPGQVSYGSAGVGTTAHLPMEELAIAAGVKWTHVPYQGDAGVTPALLGGHIDALSSTSAAWGPLVEAGRFRPLATFAPMRSTRFPNVPTLKELGYDVVTPCPLEIFGPKNLPRPIVNKLHAAFKKGLDDPEFLAVLAKLDMPVFYLGPDECEKFAQKDFERIRKIVQQLGLK